MGSIRENLNSVRSSIPERVCLVAVSKTRSCQAIREAYATGQRAFGENKVQELADKQAALPEDIEWHMIGHLQRNKVKYIAPFVHLIHGVDSMRLLKEIDKEGAKNNRVIRCLLQVHIAKETTKHGFDKAELPDLLRSVAFAEMKNVCIHGVMGMATHTSDQVQVRKEFAGLSQLFRQLKMDVFANQPSFSHLSMGMSNDYEPAIEEGSTMVRIGSKIFGIRI